MFSEYGRHRLRAAAITVLAALALALLGACSGGDNDNPLTAAQAETIANDALLVLADLPGADWDQQEAQAGLDGLVPAGAGDVDLDVLPEECQALEDAMGDLPALLGDTTPLATSSRTFTSVGQLLNLDVVSASVVVFKDADDARAAAEVLDESFSADNLEGCIQAAIIPGGDNGLQVVDFAISTPSYALEDSTALRASIDAIAVILPINLTLDLNAFQRDNVLALYVSLEVNSDLLEGEQAALLTTFANRVDEVLAVER